MGVCVRLAIVLVLVLVFDVLVIRVIVSVAVGHVVVAVLGVLSHCRLFLVASQPPTRQGLR